MDHRSLLARRLGDRPFEQVASGTIVVVPSISTSAAELRRTPAAVHLEERLLFTLLLLRHRQLRVVYVSSLPLDPAVVDYILRFVDDPTVRRRLALVSLGDGTPRALTEKLLERPEALERLRRLSGGPEEAYLVCYKVTPAEHALAARLGLPLEGPDPALLSFDTKTASRRAAVRAGVAVPDGDDGLWSTAEVEDALADLHARRPGALAAMVKLDAGFAGRGNAVVPLDRPLRPLRSAAVTFPMPDETWESYGARIEAGGAVVEELLDGPGLVAPAAQLRITPTGAVQVLTVYDMVLRGAHRQQFSGCRYPAHADHRSVVHDAAVRIARVLADEGVFGWLGLDFLADASHGTPRVWFSEVNLRMGGGTQPYWTALLLGGAVRDQPEGGAVGGAVAKAYVATDDLCSDRLAGRAPGWVVDRVDRAGLAFDAGRGCGVALQILGAVPMFGMLGATCIADSLDDADLLMADLVALLERG